MNELGFLSDEDSFDSDSSESLHEEPIDPKNFRSAYDNRQIQTLKYLRQALKENKSLKKRLNIVESELEKYEGFSFSPLKDQPSEDPRPIEYLKDDDDNVSLTTTDDKCCQCELISDTVSETENSIRPEQKDKSTSTIDSIDKTPESEKLEKIEITEKPREKSALKPKHEKISGKTVEIQVELVKSVPTVLKAHKEVQSEPLVEKETIKQLNQTIAKLNEEKLNESKNLNAIMLELKINNESLNNKVDKLVNECNGLSKTLKESNAEKTQMIDDSEQLKSFKQKNDQLEVNMQAMYLDIRKKETLLGNKNEEIAKLRENISLLNENFKVVDEQRNRIAELIAENEKHLKEKHVICQQKISELTQECTGNVKLIQEQKDEIKFLNERMSEMNGQLEKYKKDQQSFNFKEFVALKREVNWLKLEREKQFTDAISTPNFKDVPAQQPPLPPIKDSKKNIFNLYFKTNEKK